MHTEKFLFALLRSVACGAPVESEIKEQLTPEVISALYKLANKHDMAHILSKALWDFGVDGGALSAPLRQKQMMAVYRYEKINGAYAAICQTLEAAKIPFIPLKGSVIRDYYPEPWMRTSSDIDILVKEEQLDDAVAVLTEQIHYTAKPKRDHDISLYSPTGVHLELHYKTVVESDAINESHLVLAHIWDHAFPAQPDSYRYQLSEAMFYFYHIAHMAKHVTNGGCGIRPLLDLWLLNRHVTYDSEKRQELLRQGDLVAFAAGAEKLAEVWFSDVAPEPEDTQLASFILSGGVYGTVETGVLVQQKKKGGKFGYLLSKIFLPYEIIKFDYPVLQKRKWLTPVYQIVRWNKLIFKGGIKRSLRKIRANAAVSRDQEKSAGDFLQHLGLR